MLVTGSLQSIVPYFFELGYKYYNKMFSKYPTMIIPIPMIPTKVRMNCNFKTLFKIINSGSDIAITDIIKARAVPRGTPFSIKA